MKTVLVLLLGLLFTACAPDLSGPDVCTPQCGIVCGGSNGCGGTCTGSCDNRETCEQSTTTGDFFCWQETTDGGVE